MSTMGEVAILNVGAGDTKLSFDPSNPTEARRAAKIVKDMIRRGFAVLIEVGSDERGPLYRRAHDFDEATAEYIRVGEFVYSFAFLADGMVTPPGYACRFEISDTYPDGSRCVIVHQFEYEGPTE